MYSNRRLQTLRLPCAEANHRQIHLRASIFSIKDALNAFVIASIYSLYLVSIEARII